MEERIDQIINDSKECVFYLKKRVNTTNDLNEYNQYLKYINVNQENIIMLIEMNKDIDTLESIGDEKLEKLFNRIEKDIKKSYQIK
jgi:hypothetical protein